MVLPTRLVLASGRAVLSSAEQRRAALSSAHLAGIPGDLNPEIAMDRPTEEAPAHLREEAPLGVKSTWPMLICYPHE
jgi:hypothetical protein